MWRTIVIGSVVGHVAAADQIDHLHLHGREIDLVAGDRLSPDTIHHLRSFLDPTVYSLEGTVAALPDLRLRGPFAAAASTDDVDDGGYAREYYYEASDASAGVPLRMNALYILRDAGDVHNFIQGGLLVQLDLRPDDETESCRDAGLFTTGDDDATASSSTDWYRNDYAEVQDGEYSIDLDDAGCSIALYIPSNCAASLTDIRWDFLTSDADPASVLDLARDAVFEPIRPRGYVFSPSQTIAWCQQPLPFGLPPNTYLAFDSTTVRLVLHAPAREGCDPMTFYQQKGGGWIKELRPTASRHVTRHGNTLEVALLQDPDQNVRLPCLLYIPAQCHATVISF